LTEPEPDPPVEAWHGLLYRQSKADQPPPKSDEDKGFVAVAAKTLAAGSAVITALVAAVGTLDGGLNRLILNDEKATLAALGAMLLGVVLAFFAAAKFEPQIRGKKLPRPREVLVALGFVAFVGGLIGLGAIEALSIGANERPAISTVAKVTADGSSLEGTVNAGGVETDQWVYLVVSGVNLETVKDPSGAKALQQNRSTLYQTRAGPDRTGKVSASFNVAGIFGRFDFIRIGATLAKSLDDEGVEACFSDVDASIEQSCATVYPPHTRERPVLTVSWEAPLAETESNLLSVAVKSSVIDPDDVVLLDVSDSEQGRILYRTMFSPTSAGGVDASAKVAVPFTAKSVCIVGQTISAADESALTAQPSIRTCKVDSFDLTRTSFALAVAPERGS
jgi:hypothetical protein